MLSLFVRFLSSSIEFVELMVTGSRTIPLSYFLTDFTSLACFSIELFLCITPIPPASASDIAIFDSVTVSIAADNSGVLRDIFSVKLDEMSASLGRKSLYLGRSRTSSNVNALCFNFSISDYIQTH